MFPFFYDIIRVPTFDGREIVYRVLVRPDVAGWTYRQTMLANFTIALGVEILLFIGGVDVLIIWSALK